MRAKAVLACVVLVLALASVHLLLPAHAGVYLPGVQPEDFAEYEISASWSDLSGGVPVFPPISDLLETSSIRNEVQTVVGTTVTARQTHVFTNVTGTREDTITGDVETGEGNLTYWIIAGNLSEGDAILQNSIWIEGELLVLTLNATTTKTYLDLPRTVNVLEVHLSDFVDRYGSSSKLNAAFYWDKPSGVLLELEFSLFVSIFGLRALSASAHAVIADTNLWTPAAPDFQISTDPSSLTFQAGLTGTLNIVLSSVNGFEGQVQLSATAPEGLSASFDPQLVSLSYGQTASSTMTVSSLGSLAPGDYSVTVTGTSGTPSNSETVQITILPRPDFSLELDSLPIIDAGASFSTLFTVTAQSGFTGQVTLTAEAPAGITVTFNPSILTTPGTSRMRIDIGADVEPGPYTIRVTGTDGTTTHSKTVSLTVASRPVQTSSPQTIFGVEPMIFYTGLAVVIGLALALGVFLWSRRSVPAASETNV